MMIRTGHTLVDVLEDWPVSQETHACALH
jgi:hypothetical protein